MEFYAAHFGFLFITLCLCVLQLVDEARWHGTGIQGHNMKKSIIREVWWYVKIKVRVFGLKLYLQIRTHWCSRVSIRPGGAVVNIQVPSTCGVRFISWNSPNTLQAATNKTLYENSQLQKCMVFIEDTDICSFLNVNGDSCNIQINSYRANSTVEELHIHMLSGSPAVSTRRASAATDGQRKAIHHSKKFNDMSAPATADVLNINSSLSLTRLLLLLSLHILRTTSQYDQPVVLVHHLLLHFFGHLSRRHLKSPTVHYDLHHLICGINFSSHFGYLTLINVRPRCIPHLCRCLSHLQHHLFHQWSLSFHPYYLL